MRRVSKLTTAISIGTAMAFAQGGMPDMQALQAQMQAMQAQMKAAQAQMQESMRLMPFLNAPIEDKTPLSASDIQRFIAAVENHKDDYDGLTQKLQAAFSIAARQLTPGVSYDTFVRKAIALSGVKAELDAKAKAMGYADAQEAMIKTTRIMRALQKIELDRQLSQSTPQEREMFEAMTVHRIPKVDPADIKAVKPYAEQLKGVLGGKTS